MSRTLKMNQRKTVREIERIADQLRRAFEGEAWHGPALRELLADTTAAKAAERPLPAAHSIWEIVLHIAAWKNIVRRRLEGEVVVNVPLEEDWPSVKETNDAAWKGALSELEQAHRALYEKVAGFDEARLSEIVPGKNYSFYILLHGAIQHDLYHAGQIALLKR